MYLFTLLRVHGSCGLQSVLQAADIMNETRAHQISGRIWSPLVYLIQSAKSELLHTVKICVRLYLERKVTVLKIAYYFWGRKKIEEDGPKVF